ncbi:NAD(P)-dependent malic enzyme [Acidaminobacterium chupaoyuni]
MDYAAEALKLHSALKGKLAVTSKVSVNSKDDLAVAYTPGVAEPCKKIAEDKALAYEYTMKPNYIAVVSDGTAVLGLGDIGPEAAMPVMEGKCVLFNTFAGINAVPICIGTKDEDEIVKLVKQLEPSFGGINLEDISGPRCFGIEQRLKKEMNIPVFHDDQHGTAVIVLAGLINALKILKKPFSETEIVISGAGAAGISIARLLNAYGAKNVILCNRRGALVAGAEGLNKEQSAVALETNKNHESGSIADVLRGKDVFIGVSAPGLVTREMVASMNKDAIVFALANPVPEIYPEEALAGGARIIGTGRSDFPNQVNNVLVFPGIFRGALDAMASDINEEMKIAAAEAIASIVEPENLCEDYVLPAAFDPRVGPQVAAAVAVAAAKSGVARKVLTFEEEHAYAEQMMKH